MRARASTPAFRSAPAALGFLALALIWGTQFLIIRRGQQSLPPLLTVALRYAILGLVAQVLVLGYRARGPDGTRARRLAFGALQAFSMGALYWAQGHLASAVAAAVIMTEPLFVALLAHFLLAGERLSGRTLTALACGFTGVLFMLAERTLGSRLGLETLGTLLVTLSALVGALNRVLVKDLVMRVPPLILLRDTGWVVAALAAAGSFALERDRALLFDTEAVIAFVYLGLVASVAASGLYLVLLRRYRVTSLAYLQFVTALVGVATGVLLGREELGLISAAGAALVLVGLYVLVGRRSVPQGSSRAPATGQYSRLIRK